MSFIFFSDCVSTSLADSDIFFSDPMPSVGTTQAKAGNEQGKGPRVATGIMVVYPHAKTQPDAIHGIFLHRELAHLLLLHPLAEFGVRLLVNCHEGTPPCAATVRSRALPSPSADLFPCCRWLKTRA